MSGRLAGGAGSTRGYPWTGWALTAAVALAAGPTIYLASLSEVSRPQNTVFVCALILTFSAVGALISARRRGNAIGWLFISGALTWALGELAIEYGVYALVSEPGALPAAAWVAWFGGWARGFGWLLIVTFLLLLFPDGRLPGRRWRPVAWALVLYLAFFTAASLLSPVSNEVRLHSVANPLGVGGVLPRLLGEAVYASLPIPLLLSGAAVISRFGGSRGEGRQQLKWFAYAVAVMVAVFVAWILLAIAGVVEASALTFTVPMLGLPVAVGIAILKYRLYDIDLVINRTLVYLSVSAVLLLVYLAGVTLSQYLFRLLAGGESQLAVVASTLAIVALFSPLRRRMQAFVDRRFYRGRYDAARTLLALGARLRDETDVGALGREMVGVVRETLQPEHASLWLREPGGGGAG